MIFSTILCLIFKKFQNCKCTHKVGDKEQTKVDVKEPEWNQEVLKSSKAGSKTEPGSSNFEKQEPKQKPRMKPVTSGLKSWGQLGTNFVVFWIHRKMQNIEHIHEKIPLYIWMCKTEAKSLRRDQSGFLYWGKLCCIHIH